MNTPRMTRAWLLAMAWLACALPLAARAAEPLPIATFVANPDISDAKLSPSGKFIALAIANKSGRTILAVSDVDLAKPPVVVAASSLADIRAFEWVNDDWLVYNVVDLQAPLRYQDFGPGLFSVRRDGSQGRQLIRVRWNEFTTGTNIASTLLDPSHSLMRTLRDGSSNVIVGQARFDNHRELVSITPKKLDVSTGRATLAALGYPEHTVGWVFDANGVARVAQARHDGWVETYWRDSEGAPWRSIQREKAIARQWSPVAVDSAGRLYVSAPSPSGNEVITRFDVAAGKLDAEPLAAAPGFDLDEGLIFSDAHDRLLGLRVVTDAETTIWFDPARKKLQALADARFPGRISRTSCRGCDGEGDGTMLVYSYSDHDPGAYSLYRPKSGTWTTVGVVAPAIDPRRMADLDLHRMKARDGLELPVWVTRPKGAKGPLPAVLLVHGGPWLRGVEWGWHGEAQLLASRGYVVVEPEFRGSTGYGWKLFRAGWKSWGTTMQDDLADAVRWAADQGIADPKRTCIVGASYGGYAALMAPIRYPDLFKCSVAYVAVSDPRLMFEESWQSDIGRQSHFTMREMIGDPDKDAAMLKSAAPVERAAEIKIPLLMAYGSEDVRVPLEHGSKMRAALRAAGNEPEYVVYSGEGHGFLKMENRVDFYTRMEKFLAKHIGN